MMKITIFTLLIFFNFVSSTLLAEDQLFRQRAFQKHRSNYDISDVQAEVNFGRGLAAKILGKYSLWKNGQAQKYLSLLGAGVAAQVGRAELKFHFAILNITDVNAYACPGGYIFITKGLLKVMKNEAQLVGVIAHEIAHINERHVIKKLKIKGHESSFASGLGAMIGGATASYRLAAKVLIDKGYALLFETGVQKSEELQADSLAIETMMALKYDLKPYRTLVANLKSAIRYGRGTVVSKTHPSIKKRLEIIDKSIKNAKQGKQKWITNVARFNKNVKL